MTFRSWLPENTAAPVLVRGAIADIADAWSAAWFPAEPARTLGRLTRVGNPLGEFRKSAWQVCDSGLAIGIRPSGTAMLGEAILGVETTEKERPAVDLALLERVGSECLDDFKRRAAIMVGIDKSAAWRECEGVPHVDPVHRIEIANGVRSFVLTLEFSAECFTRFVKAKLPPAPLPRALGAPAEALAGVPVVLSVAVGRCGLTISELSGLAEGDVLVLDRALDAAMPLAIGGVIARRRCDSTVAELSGLAEDDVLVLDAAMPLAVEVVVARRGACTLSERGDRLVLNITEAFAA